MDNQEKLKEELWKIWNNNPVFRDNIAFLTQAHLRSLPAQIVKESVERMEDIYRYDLSYETSTPPPLHILNVEDTMDLLLENPKSFCRFGDGEFFIIMGRQIGFQEYDKELATRLCEILQSADDKCYVGLDHRYFKSTSQFPLKERDYIKINGNIIRKSILEFCNRKKLYIASTLSNFYIDYIRTNEEYRRHYEKFKQLFKNRNIVLFAGRTVFDKIQFNVFEYAASVRRIFTESKNAWRQRNEIMTAARQFPKDFTRCFILGPTATVLAYDLAQEGYTAWDIGHVAKDYDYFMKGVPKDSDEGKNFFAPD